MLSAPPTLRSNLDLEMRLESGDLQQKLSEAEEQVAARDRELVDALEQVKALSEELVVNQGKVGAPSMLRCWEGAFNSVCDGVCVLRTGRGYFFWGEGEREGYLIWGEEEREGLFLPEGGGAALVCHAGWAVLCPQRDVEELEEEKNLLEERIKELMVQLEKKEQEVDQQASPMAMAPIVGALGHSRGGQLSGAMAPIVGEDSSLGLWPP